MRDFESSELEDYFAEAAHLEDTEAMTEQGFKRFRRKHRPSPVQHQQQGRIDRSGSKAQPDVRSASVDDPDFRIQLPAPTPEPWELLRQVPLGVRRHILRRSSLISFFRDDPAAKQFDLLRTKLLKTLKERGWSRVAVVSPTSGCGTTFTAVNLALSLSRVPEIRTVLMDLNQRDPGVGSALDIQAVGDMSGFLMGEIPMERHLVRCSDTLAVGIAAVPDRNAAEILHDPQTADTLDHMHDALHADVVLYDLPPLLEHDDLMAFLPQVDGVILVADGHSTTAADLEACERVLDNQTQLLGVLLNRGR